MQPYSHQHQRLTLTPSLHPPFRPSLASAPASRTRDDIVKARLLAFCPFRRSCAFFVNVTFSCWGHCRRPSEPAGGRLSRELLLWTTPATSPVERPQGRLRDGRVCGTADAGGDGVILHAQPGVRGRPPLQRDGHGLLLWTRGAGISLRTRPQGGVVRGVESRRRERDHGSVGGGRHIRGQGRGRPDHFVDDAAAGEGELVSPRRRRPREKPWNGRGGTSSP